MSDVFFVFLDLYLMQSKSLAMALWLNIKLNRRKL